MKKYYVILTIPAVLYLSGCEKIPSPVTSASPSPSPGTSLTPTLLQRSPDEEEALRRVKSRFDSNYRKQGDTWTEEGYGRLWTTEIKQPAFTITSFPITDIDKMNNYEYRGRVIVTFIFRDYDPLKGPSGDWKGGGKQRIDVAKQNGGWKFWLLDFYEDEKKQPWQRTLTWSCRSRSRLTPVWADFGSIF